MSSSSLKASLCRSAPALRRPRPCSTPSVITRRAMMSALRSPATQSPPPQAISDSPGSPSSSRNTVPLDSKTMISRDAAAPQTAARPPAAPKVEKPRPKLRATKAAMTMVCTMVSPQLFRGCSADLRQPSKHHLVRVLTRLSL